MIGLALTPEQFKTLLGMVYIANTVANGHLDRDFLSAYDDLEQYVFSRANDAGFPAATWTHAAGGEEHHHPSRLFEGDPEVNAIMDRYDIHLLTELLSEKLAERDLEEQFGVNPKLQMLEKDYDELLDERASLYESKLIEEGLKNLRLEGIG